MTPEPSFHASIHQIITDALAASEEQLAAMRSEALLELERLRREATEAARARVREGEATAEAMLRSAERAGAELRTTIQDALATTREQLDVVSGQLRRSREQLSGVEARLGLLAVPHDEEIGDEPQVAEAVEEAAATAEAPPAAPERSERPAPRLAADLPEEGTPETLAAAFKSQRRLAFSAAETRLAAVALTNAAVGKLDLVEELVASPNFNAEERSLSLMVLLREAEQLSRMAAQFGQPPLELTERLLELRRRTTRLLHGDDPQGD